MESSSGFSGSLDIDRSGCWRVSALVLGSTLLALAAVHLDGLPLTLRLPATVFILAGGVWESWRARPGSDRYMNRLQVTPDGRLLLGLDRRSGATLVSATLAHWWSLPGVAIGLAFDGADGGPWHAILFRDRVAPEAWRRLHVRLRHDVSSRVQTSRFNPQGFT